MALYCAAFSPTGTSLRGAWAMASALGEAQLLDVTTSPAPEQVFTSQDLVIFGAPVYGAGCSMGALERLSPLRGQDTPCIVTVTYGNRDFDDALLELTRFCQERGFLPFAGAALVGEHTYGSIALGRPDAEDLLQDRAFALEAWEDFQAGWESFSPPGNFPYKEGGKGGSFTPVHHPGLHPLRAVRPAVPHAGHWGGLRRHRWGRSASPASGA